MNPSLVLGGVAVGLGVLFGRMHGVRTAFFLVSTLLMAVTIYVTLGEDLDVFNLADFGVKVMHVTVGAAIDLHLGNNVSASGGWGSVMPSLWSAPDPYINIAYVFTGFVGLTAAFAVAELVVLVSAVRE